MKRREAKSKGVKERYKHLNAELQRIARRDKKAFFSDQCKEIEENNRMGKTRDPKGIFHVNMGTKKYRNGMDLIEAKDIKKRWQEYTEELYKKIFTVDIVGYLPYIRFLLPSLNFARVSTVPQHDLKEGHLQAQDQVWILINLSQLVCDVLLMTQLDV